MLACARSKSVALVLALGVSACAPTPKPDLLLVAPFHPGLTLSQDDPDTLRAALRPALGQLRMLPRNVVSDSDFQLAISEFDPDVIWIRGQASLDEWIERIPATWKGLIVRSLPPALPTSPPSLPTAPVGSALLYADPAASDRGYAEYAVRLLHSLERGATVGEANREAARGGTAWALDGDSGWRFPRPR